MAAQVEAVALQSLVKGTPNVRVGTFVAQVLAAGARTVEVEAFAVQALVAEVNGGPVAATLPKLTASLAGTVSAPVVTTTGVVSAALP